MKLWIRILVDKIYYIIQDVRYGGRWLQDIWRVGLNHVFLWENIRWLTVKGPQLFPFGLIILRGAHILSDP